MVKYVLKEFKTIINKLKYIDTWFWSRYTVNGYQGCKHACVYCDARSERYHLAEDFDQTIIVKKNVKDQLDRRLSKARTLIPDVTALGGVNDAYQNCEKEYKNTRQILEVLLKYKYPVSLSTKSTLILRDLDLLSRIAEDTWCCLAFTITSMENKVNLFLEPRASPSEDRFRALEKIKQEYPAIQTGVNFMPIVPFLADSDENLEDMIRTAHEVKADFILFAGLTLRDKQGAYFLSKLRESYPELVEKYQALYQDNYIPREKDYLLEISRKVLHFCNKYTMKYRVKRWIPADFRRVNYLVAQDLADQAYELQLQGKRYKSRLWTAHYINNLQKSVSTLAKQQQLQLIQNVKGAFEKELEQLIMKYDKAKTLESYFK